MKQYQPADIRNVVLVGHSGSGKTTLSESMLFVSGAIKRQGKVSDGTSALDHTPEETKRKAGVYLSLAQFESNQHKFNLLDAPGYADFIGSVYAGLRASDLALVAVNAQHGVEPDTERVCEILDEQSKPRFIVVTQMDKEQADFDRTLVNLNETMNNRAVPLAYPIGDKGSFRGVVDVLENKAYEFSGSDRKPIDVPADMVQMVADEKMKLTELAAEADDELLEKYLETMELTDEELLKGLRAGITAGSVFPVIPVAAELNVGTKVLLHLVADYGPSPLDVTGPTLKDGSQLEISADGGPAAFVFNVTSDLMQQKFDLVRMFTGSTKSGDDLHNAAKNAAERMGQIYNFVGKDRIEIESLVCGDIGAASKLKATEINHTLSSKGNEIEIAPIDFPSAVHEVTVSSTKKGDEEKIGTAFHKLNEEDPTFNLEVQSDLHQTVLRTYGDQHLDVLVERMKRKYNLEVEIGKPRIPFKETIRGSSDVQYRHKKQTGGSGQFADVSIKFEPLPRGGGFEFSNEISGGVIPSKFIPAVEKGLNEAKVEGGLAGYEVVDFKARLHYGGYHDVDSSEMAFKLASVHAFRDGMEKAQPVLLEPVWEVKIRVPEDYMGDVMGDISGRRGKIQGMEPDGKYQIVKAIVPQVELHRYSTTLRSMTQGRARFTGMLSHYDEVPRDAAPKLIAQLRQENETLAHS